MVDTTKKAVTTESNWYDPITKGFMDNAGNLLGAGAAALGASSAAERVPARRVSERFLQHSGGQRRLQSLRTKPAEQWVAR